MNKIAVYTFPRLGVICVDWIEKFIPDKQEIYR